MLKNYFKIAWRNIAKRKVSTVINILGLAIGISACLIIYLITSFELSYDNFHPGKERIYRVVSEFQSKQEGKNFESQIPYPGAIAIRNEFTGIDKVATFHGYSAKVTISEGSKVMKRFDVPEPVDIILTEPQYFDIFRYEWLAGNASSALNQPFKVVLTESKARKYFGSMPFHEILGKEVIYDDSLRLTVSGIVKDLDKNTDFIFKDFISFSTIQNSFLKNANGFTDPTILDDWLWGDYQIFVKLIKGTTPAQIEAQTGPMIKKIEKRIAGAADRTVSISLQPLSNIHFNSDYNDFYSRQSHLPTLYGLMAIAAFILIIAAINFINLSTAQSIQRAKEIGIRKVLGSNRKSLVLQFLSETLILVCLAVILSMLIVNPVLVAFQAIIPKDVTLNLSNPFTLMFLLLITVTTTLLAGFYPAKILSSWSPALSLKGQGTQNFGQKSHLRKTLIIFQFTVSLIFIIGTIIVGSQINFMLNQDMGFKKDAIVNIPMYNLSGKYLNDKRNVLVEKIKQLPGIEKVSVSQEPPEVDYRRGSLLKRKDNLSEIQIDEYRAGDENYVPLYGLKIITGRNFIVPHGNDSLTEFLINETCAKQLGFTKSEDAVGHIIQTGYYRKTEFHAWNTGPVVGVLADFHTRPLNASIGPASIFATKDLYYATISIKLSSQRKQLSNFKATMANIEKNWKEIYPNEKFEYSFFDETLARYYDKEQRTSKIINTAMAIAILISCMGLFGLTTFTAEQRTKEIGIRKVLGATVTGIIIMLSKDFLKLVLISIVIASPIAWYFMHQWLQDFAYRINISWWMFALAGLGAILIALITVSFQAINAAITNLVKSLRTE